MGLTSRAGVVPLSVLADIAGPMTRTVADAVAVLQVIAGEDPSDPITVDGSPMALFRPGGAAGGAARRTRRRSSATDSKGARIGVLRQAYERDTTDPEIVQVFTRRGRRDAHGGRHHRRSRGGARSTTFDGALARAPAAASSTTSIATWPATATGCR